MNKLISIYILISAFGTLQTKASTIQSGNELLVIAENFKTANNADSAIIYFQKASIAFDAEKNTALFIHANNQTGILLNRQDKYVEAKTVLTKSLISVDRKSGSAGMPRPISVVKRISKILCLIIISHYKSGSVF